MKNLQGTMMKKLQGKVALVLGASGNGNIGQAIAQRFSEEGAQLVIAGRSEHAITQLADQLGALAIKCDIRSEGDLASMLRKTLEVHGKLDIAVNAVGQNLVKPFLDVSADELESVTRTQFIGPFLFLQAVLRVMQDRGSIIQISSVTAIALLKNHAVYMATKAAADTLIRSAAYEFGCRGIRINSLSPGPTFDAPMAAPLMQHAETLEAIRSMIPLGRIGTSRDVAEAALWLASDQCFITGENIQVNGGLALHYLKEVAPPNQ